MVAENDNTEQLRLDTTQPERAIDALTEKIRRFKGEIRGAQEAFNRGLRRTAVSVESLGSATGTPSAANENFRRNSAGRPIDDRGRFIKLEAALGELSVVTQRPTGALAALGNALGVFASRVTTTLTRLNAANSNGGSGGSGGGGTPPGGPPVGRPSSYGATIFRRVAAYSLAGTELAAILGTAREVIQLDAALRNLQAITKTSDASMKLLRERIIAVATSSKFMSTEVASAAVTLGQAGLSASQIGDALKAVTTLAAAAGTDLQSAVDIITSSIGAFNLNANEAANLANLFTAALNDSKLTMEQLSLGFSYAANAASQLGVDYQELTALLASLSNAGIRSGSTLGTGLRALFIGLTDPTNDLKDALARLGISLDDINLSSKSFTAVLKTLRDSGFTAAEGFATLEHRAAAAYAALLGQLDSIGEVERGLLGTSAATDAASTQMESFANTAKQTATNLTAIASTSFQPLLDGLQQILKYINSLMRGLQDLGPLLPLLGVAGGAFAARGAVAGVFSLYGAKAAASAVGGAGGAVVALGITGLIAALSLLKGKTDELAASTEEARGKSDAARVSYQEVGAAIIDLLNKEQNLRSNKDELSTTTVKLGERFRGLGLDVNGLEGDFDGLLAKLREVEGTATSSLQASLALLASRQGEELRDVRGQLPRLSRRLTDRLIGGGRTAYPDEFGDVANRSSYGPSDYAAYTDSSRFVGQYMSRLYAGGGLGASDNTLAQNALAELINNARDNDPLYDNLRSVIEDAAAITNNLKRMEDTREKTLRETRVTAAREDDAFKKLELEAAGLISSSLRRKPKEIPNNPVETEKNLADFLDSVDPRIKSFEGLFGAYGDTSEEAGAAVGQSQIFTRLKALRTDVERELAGVKPEAQRIRVAIGELTADATDSYIKNLQREIQGAQNTEQLRNISTAIAKAIDTLYVEQAEIFAQKELGLGPGEYSVSSYGNLKITPRRNGELVEPRKDQKLAVERYNRQFSEQNVGRTAEVINAQAQKLDDDSIRDRIKTYGLRIAAMDRQVRDAFKNVDQYTPKSEIIRRADQALDTLAEGFSLALDQLNKEFYDEFGRMRENFRLSDYLERKEALGDQYDSRRDELTDRYKDLKYDYSRPLKPGDDPLSNIRTALMTPGPAPDDWANTFSETMVAAIETVRGSMGNLFSDIFTGTKSALASFKEFAAGILQAMLNVITSKIVQTFLNMILKFLPGTGGASAAVDSASAASSVDYAVGGTVKRYAAGGTHGMRDSVLAALTPGEVVIRNAAVEAIGRDNLEKLNAMGNTRMSRGRVPTFKTPPPGVTNVYVVAPQNPPQLGKNDILVAVAQDILEGGVTKRLIKSVSMGM